MSQAIEQRGPAGLDLQRFVGIARRRHFHFLIPMFLGWLAVWGAGWILPAQYKSGTLILVEQPTMPRDYVVPNVNDDLQDRLQSITQQILSRTRLLQIADELTLYSKDRARLSPDEIVERMRKDINIELVQDTQGRVSSFKVYYTASDPAVAQQVTSKLTNLFINENLEARQQASEGTTKFLHGQLEAARQDLEAQEERIREFKGHNASELPNQLGSNLQILSGLQSQLQTEANGLNNAKQQRVYLETLLRQYRTLQAPTKDGEGTPMGLAAIDQDLDKMRSQLTELNSRYTPEYPEVRSLKDRIAKTEKMREQLLSEFKTKGESVQSDASAAAPSYDGASSRDPVLLLQVKSQLQANEAEIKNREETVAELKDKVSDYQARLNREPTREQQLSDLARGYDQSKATYDELLKKESQSAMATSMELLQQGERFRILDPPSLPLKPSFPDRMKFCGIGLIFGLALGAAVTWAFETMDDRIYREQELKYLLPVSVLAEIPIISTAATEIAERRMAWLGWAAAVFIFAAISAGTALSYLRG